MRCATTVMKNRKNTASLSTLPPHTPLLNHRLLVASSTKITTGLIFMVMDPLLSFIFISSINERISKYYNLVLPVCELDSNTITQYVFFCVSVVLHSCRHLILSVI